MRVGIGYDVHKLVYNRKLILGGIEISYHKGLLGHSDADVLVHAIIDALLGAAGLGDIGTHFSSDDDKYKNISSLKLLDITNEILKEKECVISNIDATIVMQEPKLKQYILYFKKNIAHVLHIEQNKINIKATTEEGLGFTGHRDGVACYAVCLLVVN
jgi:2-C-methyl-D-erythritol 2,4-cyclodiphosphate synthase